MELKREKTECQMKKEIELIARKRDGTTRLACESKTSKQTDARTA